MAGFHGSPGSLTSQLGTTTLLGHPLLLGSGVTRVVRRFGLHLMTHLGRMLATGFFVLLIFGVTCTVFK